MKTSKAKLKNPKNLPSTPKKAVAVAVAKKALAKAAKTKKSKAKLKMLFLKRQTRHLKQ
jgi:hypothetical protein